MTNTCEHFGEDFGGDEATTVIDAATEHAWDVPLYSTRSVEVDGVEYTVPFGIIPTQFGWRARWSLPGYPVLYWRFEARDLSRAEKLEQAIRWYRMPHPRQFLVQRIATEGGTGREGYTPRFTLLMKNYGLHRRPWMSVNLGGLWFITEERIQEAIQYLNRNLDHYEVRRLTMGHKDAAAFRTRDIDPMLKLVPGRRPMRVGLHDLLAWTGTSELVAFDPPETVAPGRKRLYWPELEDQIHPRCPTITALL